MKKLQTSDVFAALRIVKAANLKEALKPTLMKVAEGEKNISDIGIETVLSVIEGLSDAKSEGAFYEFLSAPFEMSAEDVAALPLEELLADLKKLGEENDLKSFFKSLSAVITSK